MRDPPFVNCSYAVICSNDGNGSASVCYKNVDAGYFSIMVMSKVYPDLLSFLEYIVCDWFAILH